MVEEMGVLRKKTTKLWQANWQTFSLLNSFLVGLEPSWWEMQWLVSLHFRLLGHGGQPIKCECCKKKKRLHPGKWKTADLQLKTDKISNTFAQVEFKTRLEDVLWLFIQFFYHSVNMGSHKKSNPYCIHNKL